MQASAPSDQYLCAFICCVLLCVLIVIFCPYSEQFIYFFFTRRPYCLFIIVFYRAAVWTTVGQIPRFKAVMASITVIKVQSIVTSQFFMEYTDFYRDKERWRYLQKLDTKNRLLSLDGFTDSEGNPLDFITDEAVDIAETVVNAVMVDRLKAALPLLSDSEQELIQAIFFDGLSEREVGARLGITQSVVNKRKARILIKLRKIIEN